MSFRALPATITVIFATGGFAAAPFSPGQVLRAAEPVIADASFPSNMAFAPDGRLFYTELLSGDIRVVGVDGELETAPFDSFEVFTGSSETGLLGIAIPADFTENPWVYVYLSDAATLGNQIVAVRAVGDVGVERRLILTLLSATHGYHNGGDLMFGSDGELYVAVGETHESERAQNLADPGGKILRIHPDGSIPADDPFRTGAAYTIGHRNSFGLCQDPSTGAIWETENGPAVDDEVNLLRPGANYGWPEVTGRAGDPRFEDPVAVFGDTVALTGCAVWRDELYVGAYLTGGVYRIDPDGAVVRVAELPTGVTDLQVGPDDLLYVATEGGIYAIADRPPGVPITGIEERPDDMTWITALAAFAVAGALASRLWIARRARDR